jgi:hypothetical protein
VAGTAATDPLTDEPDLDDAALGATIDDALPPTAARAVSRSLASRRSTYVEEVQRLLDAGLALMVEGQDAPRVADIVRRSGLSNQAFYRHFASKDELIVAVVESTRSIAPPPPKPSSGPGWWACCPSRAHVSRDRPGRR